MLGDTGTAALVGRAGSVDWLCLPRFDSAACFAALLGHARARPVAARPSGPGPHHPRATAATRFVLDTTHETDTGVVRVTDLMPFGDGRADIVRGVEGLDGRSRWPRVGRAVRATAKVRPWVRRSTDQDGRRVIRAIAGPDMLVLRGDRLPRAERPPPRGRVHVARR